MEEWRYLEVKEEEVAKCNAIHATLLEGMFRGISLPTVFLEECPAYVISLGRNQCCEEEVDVEACKRLGVQIERRETGGGAGFMLPGNTAWGVCTSLKDKRTSSNMLENFEIFSRGVVLALQELGLDARFEPINDLCVKDKKIGGMTALTRGDALLIYGSLIWDFDFEMYKQIAKVPQLKLQKKGVPSVQKRITTLTEELGERIEPAELRRLLVRGFERALGVKLRKGWLSEEEERIWAEKVRKCRSPSFIFRPGRCSVANTSAIYPAEKGIIRVSAFVDECERRILDISITGDFMQLDDVSFSELAERLRGLRAEEGEVRRAVESYFSEARVRLIGAKSEDFVEAILEATKDLQSQKRG